MSYQENIFSDITDEEDRTRYGGNASDNLTYSREHNIRMEPLQGETMIQPGHYAAFSPHAVKKAYISVRTADRVIA